MNKIFNRFVCTSYKQEILSDTLVQFAGVTSNLARIIASTIYCRVFSHE